MRLSIPAIDDVDRTASQRPYRAVQWKSDTGCRNNARWLK